MEKSKKIINIWEYNWIMFWWKADNLNYLYQKWFNIANGFCISSHSIDKKLIEEYYERFIISDKYIIRSSANCEDWKKLSYAWMFKSIEWKYKNWLLHNNIKKVFDSINNSFLDMYEKNIIGKIIKNRKMNVLIQEYIVWDYSWVYLSNINDERVLWIIKWWNKLLVDWQVNWINIYMNKNFKIIKQEYNIQEKILDWNFNILEYNKKVIIENKLFLNLIKEFIKIEKIFNFDVDIEWTIKEDKIYILQVRPITIN